MLRATDQACQACCTDRPTFSVYAPQAAIPGGHNPTPVNAFGLSTTHLTYKLNCKDVAGQRVKVDSINWYMRGSLDQEKILGQQSQQPLLV
jgi:hypothetical protein